MPTLHSGSSSTGGASRRSAAEPTATGSRRREKSSASRTVGHAMPADRSSRNLAWSSPSLDPIDSHTMPAHRMPRRDEALVLSDITESEFETPSTSLHSTAALDLATGPRSITPKRPARSRSSHNSNRLDSTTTSLPDSDSPPLSHLSHANLPDSSSSFHDEATRLDAGMGADS
eukprot:TRINITY_DN10995_c0_g1_i5.p1 TRINITY_DN10995_c0_g1~~TRINITY_DN10995_c0_g1_i5.p1  ORF type:complete len:174 (+),score=21.25 TRINITY_DN10995_c0_g1_i5:52-573(+)